MGYITKPSLMGGLDAITYNTLLGVCSWSHNVLSKGNMDLVASLIVIMT